MRKSLLLAALCFSAPAAAQDLSPCIGVEQEAACILDMVEVSLQDLPELQAFRMKIGIAHARQALGLPMDVEATVSEIKEAGTRIRMLSRHSATRRISAKSLRETGSLNAPLKRH